MLARCTCKMKALKSKDFEANTETEMWVRRFEMSLGSFNKFYLKLKSLIKF